MPTPTQQDSLQSHLRSLVAELRGGYVIPFFGAGANRCGFPPNASFAKGERLPLGKELAEYLANKFGYPMKDRDNLPRVCQYVDVVQGLLPLYRELHSLFDADFQATPVHQFWARLPRFLREHGCKPTPIIVTSNYDTLLEDTFLAEKESFDLIYYVADGPPDKRGRFWHSRFENGQEGARELIERPSKYKKLSPWERTVILKIHGAVDRRSLGPDNRSGVSEDVRDSFVITEDHYIEFLTRTQLESLLPMPIPAILKTSHFLFLGHSLIDWNLRVMLYRIWSEQILHNTSWAVQLPPEDADEMSLNEKFWRRRNVDIVYEPLDVYINSLTDHLGMPRWEERPHGSSDPSEVAV